MAEEAPESPAETGSPTALTLCTRVSNVKLPEGRLPCPKCGKRVALYCSACLIAVCDVLAAPRVKLPLTLDVLRGSEEADSKSTASQALMLSSPSRLYRLPSFPAYPDPSRVLLLYPSPAAVCVRDLPDLSRFDTLAVVDTTWVKVGRVFQMPELCAPFTHVKLGSYTTLFWRHQPLGPHCVSSIESVYFFMREWEEEVARRAGKGGYDGRHDDLLLLFLDQHRRIAAEYARAGGGKVVSSRAAPFLSPAAPQAESLTAARAGARAGDEEVREGGGKRRRVKGAWSVAPTVLGARAGEAAGEAARQEYVAQNMPWIAAAGGGEGGAAAAAQFIHISRTNQHGQ